MKSPKNSALIAVAAGLMTLTALPVAALAQQRQPTPAAPAQQHNGPMSSQHNTPQPQPYQSQPGSNANHNSGQNSGQNSGHNSGNQPYGAWNTAWGARPAAPPRSFTRHSDWYRHVRACQQRYRSYDARTDRYTVRRGQTAVCRL